MFLLLVPSYSMNVSVKFVNHSTIKSHESGLTCREVVFLLVIRKVWELKGILFLQEKMDYDI